MDRSLNSLSYTLEKSREKKRRKRRSNDATNSTNARTNVMNLEEWYLQTPIVTRCYLTMSFLITAGCALEVKKNSFFLHKASFVVENPIALQTGAGKRAGLTRSLVLSLSLSLSLACRSSPRSRSTSTPTWSSKNTNSGVWSPTFSSSALWV